MENKIDILAIQEVEIGPDFDENTLVIPGYTLETENNTHKSKRRCSKCKSRKVEFQTSKNSNFLKFDFTLKM